MSIVSGGRPSTTSGASSCTTNDGTLVNCTRSHLASRQVAAGQVQGRDGDRPTAVTSPAGVSSTTVVLGSTMGTMPVSSSTVTLHCQCVPPAVAYVQMQFDPDIDG